jgi:hypothetical protein
MRGISMRFLLALALAVFAFVYGVGVGRYQWPPYLFIQKGDDFLGRVSSKVFPYQGENEALRFAFTSPLIRTEKLFSPITSPEGVYRANQGIFMKARALEGAYEALSIKEARELRLDAGKTRVLRVRFTLNGQNHEAYAYVLGEGKRRAALIIPGSSPNQSSAIYRNDPKNYHYGILSALDRFDTFVFIKPNEDILAWHDGAGKLHRDFIINYHLNRGGSYSVSYLVQTLALAKYLGGKYPERAVIGLSQGGAAALINSLQSRPDWAVIASGYNGNPWVEQSGHGQLVTPNGLQGELSNMDTLKNRLRDLPTRFLLTWGRREPAVFRVEAEGGRTCKALEGLSAVYCVIHEGGHVFPIPEIRNFLREDGVQK